MVRRLAARPAATSTARALSSTAMGGSPRSSLVQRASLVMGPRQKRLEATAVFPEHNHHDEEEPAKKYDSDLVVVLDMDECLIHTKFLTPHMARYAHQLLGSSSWEHRGSRRKVDSFKLTLPDGDVAHVHKRPHLHEFLERVSSLYETHVFTAATQVYAKPVLDYLDPTSTIFTKRWYRDSCTPNGQAFVKNLEIMQKEMNRIVLVDNNPLSFLANPSNGILVSSFYNNPNDSTLLAVLGLLEELDGVPDVRPTLNARFRLKAALQEMSTNGLA
eukprot:CAMPEP_0116846440 /NCGR_PEP_ID=MMETSP0418-20121206/13834_1 /TAXON_ID=1158023 /ORGANISM="Astrosyne radiata, Strain 13vi08-1A" /LENGTH=273 /DNA_ID=CAMNT_0004477683 /DNA_START=223 /DNA_END=1044 /DNA_ORIENTATION=+